jgi:hypothetical protein
LTGAWPAPISSTSRWVVAEPAAVTPASAMPWSAANSTVRAPSKFPGGQRPCTAAAHTASSSSAPSDPAGTANRCWRSRAACPAAGSGSATSPAASVKPGGGWNSLIDTPRKGRRARTP